jgi:hypothetical protein
MTTNPWWAKLLAKPHFKMGGHFLLTLALKLKTFM